MYNQINPSGTLDPKGRRTKRMCFFARGRLAAMLFTGLALCGLVLPPSGKASEFDKKTILTFNQSVQIPGAVLSPGTYVVKRADPMGNPDIVRFFNADETRLYSTVLAMPVERGDPSDVPVVGLAESRGNSPQALKTWFYPGDVTGAEFLYPKGSSVLSARASDQLIPRSSAATVPTSDSVKPETPVTCIARMTSINSFPIFGRQNHLPNES